jgi:hypothetical protein
VQKSRNPLSIAPRFMQVGWFWQASPPSPGDQTGAIECLLQLNKGRNRWDTVAVHDEQQVVLRLAALEA